MNPFEVNMSKALRKLAEDIIPDDELLKKAKVCTDQVNHTVSFYISRNKYTVFLIK